MILSYSVTYSLRIMKENPDVSKFIQENQEWIKSQTLKPEDIEHWVSRGVNLNDQKESMDDSHHSFYNRWDYDPHTSIDWE